MKILKEGNPNGWEIEQTCTGKGNGDGGCNAKLLVNESDIYITTHTDYGGDTDYFYTFKCPCCGVETDIPEKDIVNRVRREVLKKYREEE